MIVVGIVVAVLLLLFCLYLWALKPRPEPKTSVEPLKVNYAHRGLWGRNEVVENTMQAFEAAEREGYGIELDVRLTADGQIVVFHDDTLERMCNRPERVDALTASELSWIYLANSYDTMPLFEDVLARIDHKVPLCIELKGNDPALCEKLAEMMKYYDGYYSVESFNPFLLNWYRKNCPRVVRGQLTTNLFRSKSDVSLFGKFACLLMCFNYLSRPDYISFDIRYAKSLPVVLCRRFFHALCFGWTVETTEDYERLKNEGVIPIFQKILPPAKEKE